MKITYNAPSIEVILFSSKDVLKASATNTVPPTEPPTTGLVLIAEDPMADAYGDGDVLAW